MATVNYRIKSFNRSKGYYAIYVRLRSTVIDIERSTGLIIPEKSWSSTKQLLKSGSNKSSLNEKLMKFKLDLIAAYNKCVLDQYRPSVQWFEEVIDSLLERGKPTKKQTRFFLDYVSTYIEESDNRINLRTGRPISIRTIQDYQGTLNKLKQYEVIHGTQLRFLDINIKFHKQFISYCRSYRKLRPKTIGGVIDNIKLFMRNAELDGIKVCQDYKRPEFISPDNLTDDFALSIEEIDQIVNLDYSANARLCNARDWFVIGLWTGLRVSDLLLLNKRNIVDGFIQVLNKKTDIYVVLPIHKHAQAVLDSRDGRFPRKISPQKFNNYIKEIAKDAGLDEDIQGSKLVKRIITDYDGKKRTTYRKEKGVFKKYELISSHICRRTFATLHYGKIDTLSIMRITGHKTERQFLDYVKIPPREHALRIMQHWKETN